MRQRPTGDPKPKTEAANKQRESEFEQSKDGKKAKERDSSKEGHNRETNGHKVSTLF